MDNQCDFKKRLNFLTKCVLRAYIKNYEWNKRTY